ncbi:type IV pilus major pilin [Citrobacter braakii]|uniref:type IV pilus major pilin n=1 Tax=Citrobacter braakii TaxID=57706 RepID=UPI0018EA3755|nr:type IV pilus major pilin [Citrobacter braakii]WAD29072.1 type IV pilus major pilin [Citrobacter braakii]
MKSMIHSWKKKAAQYRELKKQKGVTLLEIIIVLGIIGIIAAGVVILAQRAFTSQDISNLVDNTNSVRVAMTEAYKDADAYPAKVASNTETKAGIKTSAGKSAIVGLVKMGKISPDEAFNGFSNDAFEIGPAITSKGATKAKGFYVVINGLATEDCRNIISQIGSQWDYVGTTTAAPGAMSATAQLDMSVAPDETKSILKTLAGNKLNPTNIVANSICDADPNGTTNAIILGSK